MGTIMKARLDMRPKPKRLNRNDHDLVLPENQEACSHKLADLLVFYADFDDLVIQVFSVISFAIQLKNAFSLAVSANGN